MKNSILTVAVLISSIALTACGGSSNSAPPADQSRLGALDRNSPEARKLTSGSWCSDGPRMKRFTFSENGELFLTLHSSPRRQGPGPGTFDRGTWGFVSPRLYVRMSDISTTWIVDFSRPRLILLQSEHGAQPMRTVKLHRCGPNPYRG